MAANVFQAFYETEALGQNYAGTDVAFPGGTGNEWGEQKNEDPYGFDGEDVDPAGTTTHIEIVNTQSPPQGSQCVQMYIKTDDLTERRCQLAEYNNSALSALTTIWVRYKMKIAQTITAHIYTVPEPWGGYIRTFEFLPYISGGSVFHTCPALMFQRFSGANESNRLWIVFNTGDDTGTNEQLSDDVPVNQWVTMLIKNVVHHTAGEIQIWMDGVEQLHLTGLDTYPTGSDSMQVTQECSGGFMDSVSPTIIYYDDYQVNAANVWATSSPTQIAGNRGGLRRARVGLSK